MSGRSNIALLGLFCSFLTFISACNTPVKECANRWKFIEANAETPVFYGDLNGHPDSIKTKINQLYKEDLCARCDWVDFAIPFEFEGNSIKIAVQADFFYPICEDCLLHCGIDPRLSISLNHDNQIMVGHHILGLDSLHHFVLKYLNKDPNIGVPIRYYQSGANFRIGFRSGKTDIIFLKNIITVILESYLHFVEQKLLTFKINFCELNDAQLTKIKMNLPLHIQLDLGRERRWPSIDITSHGAD